ncbi:hypothetical protein L484_022377 [Morus notabilis]|uniref:DUF7086 domain-containing protein n=1 Tax=Morus notabilis TaxID=981085 RepID=W9QJG5_9ROSA|nr:uncharacterized protein LOC21405193 [Morus notabilis]EXB38475.1 hypothetical protein L484_022377 [Morus notabilis]
MTNDQDLIDEEDFLALTLSPPVSRPRPPLPQPQAQLFQNPQLQPYLYHHQPSQNLNFLPAFAPAPPPPQPPRPVQEQPSARQPARSSARTRRNAAQPLRPGKSETVPVLFPWATPRRATVQNLDYLLSAKIETIAGEVQCKQCQQRFQLEYNLAEEFGKLWKFIADKKADMKDRAPKEWENPEFPDCMYCDQKGAVKPVVAEKKREINWLFLLLGRFLNCLTLDQLKYFCKHTRNHRTGAKDRVLYLTYLGLCKQLDPSGPFDALDR